MVTYTETSGEVWSYSQIRPAASTPTSTIGCHPLRTCSHLFLCWKFAAWRFNSPDCFLPDLMGKFAASNQCERYQPVQEVGLFRSLTMINLNFTNTKTNCNEQECNLCCPTPWKSGSHKLFTFPLPFFSADLAYNRTKTLLFHGQFLLCQFFAQSFLQKNNYCIGTIGDVPILFRHINPAECQGTAALLE